MDLIAILKADLNATRKYTGGVTRSLFPSLFAVAMYRLTNRLRDTPLKPIGWVLYYANLILTGAEILPSAQFGPGLFLVHPHGVVISPGVRAGRNVTLFGSVIVGSDTNGNGTEARVGDPTLGDDVTVLAKASVIGPITLGDGVTVGAHSLVLHDVPARSVVAGVPARVLRRY